MGFDYRAEEADVGGASSLYRGGASGASDSLEVTPPLNQILHVRAWWAGLSLPLVRQYERGMARGRVRILENIGRIS